MLSLPNRQRSLTFAKASRAIGSGRLCRPFWKTLLYTSALSRIASRTASGNESSLGSRILRVLYPLPDARPVTLSPSLNAKLSCTASRMATQRDVEHNQMLLNACVQLDGPWLMTVPKVTHYYSPGPSESQSARQRCVNPFFCVMIFVKNHPGTALKSPSRTEDYPLNYPGNALK